MQRLCLWSVYSFIILFTGYVFELLGKFPDLTVLNINDFFQDPLCVH